MANGLARLRIDGLWGAVDRDGRLVIAPQFDELDEFSEGLAAAKLDGRWGAVDVQGTWVIPPRFDELLRFSSGLAGALHDGAWGYVDRNARWVIAPQFASAGDFVNGTAVVSLGFRRDRLIDATGVTIKNFDSNVSVRTFADAQGRYTASISHPNVLRHRDGRTQALPESAMAASGGPGLVFATAQADDGVRYGTIAYSGEWVTPAKFRSLQRFVLGHAVAELPDAPVGASLVLVDRAGHQRSDAAYASIERHAGGWLLAKRADTSVDVLAIDGKPLARLSCGQYAELTDWRSTAWSVLVGCGKTVLIHAGRQAFEQELVATEAHMTGAHVLLLAEEQDGKARDFVLIDSRGRRILGTSDLKFTSPYDSIQLFQPEPRSREPMPMPVALIIRQFKTIELLRWDYSIASHDSWQYELAIARAGEGPVPMKTAQGWGAVDARGEWVVAPRYRELGAFRDGIAFATSESGDDVVVTTAGKEVRLPQEGRGYVRDSGLVWGTSDEGSILRIDPAAKDVSRVALPEGAQVERFRNGLAPAAIASKWGLLNAEGRWVVAPMYDWIEAVSATYDGPHVGWKTRGAADTSTARASVYGWVDNQGVERVPPQYDDIRFDGAADALIVTKGSSNGLLSLDGRVIFEPIYDTISNFGDGWFATHRADEERLMDSRGEWLIVPDERRADTPFDAGETIRVNDDEVNLYNGRAAVRREGRPTSAEGSARPARYGYLDRSGKVAIPYVYDAAADFSEERAAVVWRGNLALIDTRGTLLLHSAWLCGRRPVLLNGKAQVIWPPDAVQTRSCSRDR